MSNITIVTAFFDIGRNDWTVDKGYPHYLQRSVDTYVERFSRLAKLDNELIVYTSPDLVDKIAEACNGRPKVKIVAFEPKIEFKAMRDAIETIQQSDEFKKLIHPSQIKNPEYWNPDYVLVTNLKAFCSVNNLSYKGMRKVALGQQVSGSYNGWRILDRK